MALPGLTVFCPVASLKVSAMIAFDVVTKLLDTEKFPPHTIADLNSGLHFMHTRTHARTHAPTPTHTHAHTREVFTPISWKKGALKS